MQSGQLQANAREKELDSINEGIKKFVVYKYKDEKEWNEFAKGFCQSNNFTLDEKFTCLTSFFNSRPISYSRCIALFADLVSTSSSADHLFAFVSQWLPKLYALLAKDDKSRSAAKAEWAFIEKIFVLKPSIQDVFKILTYVDSEMFVLNLLINSYSLEQKKDLWHLLYLLHEHLKTDSQLAPQIYALLQYQTPDKKESIGHHAVQNKETEKLFFMLLDELEKAGISQGQIFDLLRLQAYDNPLELENYEGTAIISQMLLSRLASKKPGKLNPIAARYLMEIIQSDRMIEFLSLVSHSRQAYEYGKSFFYQLLKRSSSELVTAIFDRLELMASWSDKDAQAVADVFLLPGHHEAVLRELMDDMAYQSSWVNHAKSEALNKRNKVVINLQHLFLENNIRSKDIVAALSVGERQEITPLAWLVFNANLDMAKCLSTIHYLVRAGYDTVKLRSSIIRIVLDNALSPIILRRFSELLVSLHQNNIEAEAINSFLSQQLKFVVDPKINQMLSTYKTMQSIHDYFSYVLIKYQAEAGNILFPLANAGMIPKKEFNTDVRDAVFNYVLQLPKDEKNKAFDNIKDRTTPLGRLFLVNNDILFIRRAPTLPRRYSDKIDVELEVAKAIVEIPPGEPSPSPSEASSPPNAKKKTKKPAKTFEQFFPSVPTNPLVPQATSKKREKEPESPSPSS